MTGEEFEKENERLQNPFTPWTNCYSNMMAKARIDQYGYDARIPKDIKVPDDFINELKDYSNRLIGCSQECEGTFKIKNGDVVDIHLTRVALIPKFKDKE